MFYRLRSFVITAQDLNTTSHCELLQFILSCAIHPEVYLNYRPICYVDKTTTQERSRHEAVKPDTTEGPLK